MSPHLAFVAVVLAVVSVSQAHAVQTIFRGACPKVTPQATVALNSLEGAWYEQLRYMSQLENFKRCITWTFKTTSTTSMTAQTLMTSPIGNVQSTIGSTISRTGTNGQFTYRITALPGTSLGVNRNYDFIVVAVTADYLVAWSCRNKFLNLSNEQILWIMTRLRTPATAVIPAALAAATAQSLNTSRLVTIKQTAC